MYVTPNFATKGELKKAVKAGELVVVFSPGPFPAPENGQAYIEGPHYPEPHRWYAKVEVKDRRVVKIIA